MFVAFFALTFPVAAQKQSATFNWAQPSTLSPAFPAPTSDNRYGDYISNVEFKTDWCTLCIDDSSVAQLSQRARFLYGYLTNIVEMRAYANSLIKITPTDTDYEITNVVFAGAKVSEYYIHPDADESLWATTTSGEETAWQIGEGLRDSVDGSVFFAVDATINCTSTVVVLSKKAGVADITIDSEDSEVVWFTLQGVQLPQTPTQPGLYIKHAGGKSFKVKLL